jgi:ArsR family transcriptional regulator, arsenate/arsenite/antimonite-responsive transcriptional repressor
MIPRRLLPRSSERASALGTAYVDPGDTTCDVNQYQLVHHMAALPDHTRAVTALRFRALGDETRLRILEQLAPGERSVTDLMTLVEIGQSLMSHHLRILREAGLVIDRRDGRWIHYSIAEPALAACRLALYEMEPMRSR